MRTKKYAFRGKYRTRLQNAVLLLKNTNGVSRTKLANSIDTTYGVAMEIINELKEIGFIQETKTINPLSPKTNTPHHALSNNPKTVTRWNYNITDRGKRFLMLYQELENMLFLEQYM